MLRCVKNYANGYAVSMINCILPVFCNTYDQEEALEVADKIVVMNKGIIEQHGTPERGIPQTSQ